jgi:hypothetical protein
VLVDVVRHNFGKEHDLWYIFALFSAKQDVGGFSGWQLYRLEKFHLSSRRVHIILCTRVFRCFVNCLVKCSLLIKNKMLEQVLHESYSMRSRENPDQARDDMMRKLELLFLLTYKQKALPEEVGVDFLIMYHLFQLSAITCCRLSVKQQIFALSTTPPTNHIHSWLCVCVCVCQQKCDIL